MRKFFPYFLALLALLLTSVHPAHAAITTAITMKAHNSCPIALLSSFAACELSAYDALVPCPSGSGTATYNSTYTTETLSCPRTSNGLISSGEATVAVYSVGSCPTNSTSSGTYTCTCNTGYTDSGSNTCTASTPACPLGTLSQGIYDVGTVDNGSHPPFDVCSGGCSASYTGGDAQYRMLVAGVYHYGAQGSYELTGVACSSGASPPSAQSALPADSCGTGQTLVTGEGGKAKCYDTTTGVAVDPNSTAANDASAAAQTAAQTAAANAAGAAASAVVAASGGTAAEAQAAAAAAAAAGAAAGKAASDQTKPDPCETNPTSVACLKLGNEPSSDTVPTDTPSFSATSVAFASAAGCPAPITFNLTMPHMTGSYSISYQPFCDFAAIIRPIFLALAAITAAFIFAGGLP